MTDTLSGRCGYSWDIHKGTVDWPLGRYELTEKAIMLKSFRNKIEIPFSEVSSAILFSKYLWEGKIRLHIPEGDKTEIFIHCKDYQKILLKLKDNDIRID